MDTPKYIQPWIDRVGKFADAVGKTIDEITEKLSPIVGEPNEEALLLLDNKEAVPDADIKAALADLKIPTGKLNLHLNKLRSEKPDEKPEATNTPGIGFGALSILPSIPDETSFMEMLKTGGVLKVEMTEVISAIKAAVAKTVGLYELPERIAARMEEYAMSQEEPCGEEFYAIQKLLTEKKYGDILSAVGVSGAYISESRKKAFFAKIDEKLWPSLKSFNNQLTAWAQSWTQGVASQSMMVQALTQMLTGVQTPGALAHMDTMPLRTAGEEVVNDINRVFAGPGIPIARALAYDATRIMGILEKKELPVQVGATSKDQMLKDLGISVGAGVVQLEQSITRYALAIMSLTKVTADNELAYFTAMIQLGSQIPWDRLGNKGIGAGLR